MIVSVNAPKKRLRVLAGPNGSGKSTLAQDTLRPLGIDMGISVNADELKVIFIKEQQLNLADYGVTLDQKEFVEKLKHHSLASRIESVEATLANVEFNGDRIVLREGYEVEDYFVSFIALYLWEELLDSAKKFSVETVMSHPSKLDFMRRAKAKGFKVYLYFVALPNPEMNISRVRGRIAKGGHAVDEEKIFQRYYRTMQHLHEALKIADNAYLFDNSFGKPTLFAVKKDGRTEILSEQIPKWFETYVLNVLKVKN